MHRSPAEREQEEPSAWLQMGLVSHKLFETSVCFLIFTMFHVSFHPPALPQLLKLDQFWISVSFALTD